MTLEEQVCSLELAKKLKELGLVQKSHFHWFPTVAFRKETLLEKNEHFSIVESEVAAVIDEWYVSCDPAEEMRENYSAFTVAELGEMLPLSLWSGKKEYWLTTRRWSHGWEVDYITKGEGHPKIDIFSALEKTEADARAKMLIYLLESGNINLTK